MQPSISRLESLPEQNDALEESQIVHTMCATVSENSQKEYDKVENAAAYQTPQGHSDETIAFIKKKQEQKKRMDTHIRARQVMQKPRNHHARNRVATPSSNSTNSPRENRSLSSGHRTISSRQTRQKNRDVKSKKHVSFSVSDLHSSEQSRKHQKNHEMQL